MQELLSSESTIPEESTLPRTSSWSRLGTVLLMASLAVLLLKCAPLYSPFGWMALGGYALTLLWKKKGLTLSLLLSSVVVFFTVRTGTDLFWSLSLLASIALSWLLIAWKKEEEDILQLEVEKKFSSAGEKRKELEKQLRDAKAASSRGSQEFVLEKERLNRQLQDAIQTLKSSENEKEKLVQQCASLSQDLLAAKHANTLSQQALEDVQAQLTELQLQMSAPKTPLVPMEEIDLEEQVRIEQVLHEQANLRRQFEEKSEMLDLSRKELFRTENELLALKKEFEEKTHELPEESVFFAHELERLEKEMGELENQVTHLQEFISALLLPKKRAPRVSKLS